MDIKTLFFTTLTGVTLLFSYSGVAQTPLVTNSGSSRILKEARVSNKMNWGLRAASPPTSYVDNFGNPKGFCVNLIDLLEKYLIDKKLTRSDFRIVKYQINIDDRFLYTRYPYAKNHQLRLDGECGPDSGKNSQEGIRFSNPFFATKTLLLIRKSKSESFSFLREKLVPPNSYKPKIGVTNSTITFDRVIRYFNPSEVDIVNIKGGRAGAIAALSTGEVDALASDEILLNRMLNELKKDEFYIESQWIISRENYALILPGDDEEWIKIINNFLSEKQEDIQNLIRENILGENLPVPTPYPPDEPILKLILLILLGITTISCLTWVGYMYWVRRQNSSTETKPNLDPKTPIFADGYALLIGIGECAYQRLSLPVTVKDVQALHQVLVDPNFCAYPNDTQHIRLLHDQEATRNQILKELNWLKEQAEDNPEATVVVYYSGHGWFSKSQNRYYLLPHDTDPLDLEGSSLSAEEFTNALRQIKSKRLLVIIDSCHAAGMATARKAKAPSDFEEIPIPKSVIDDLSKGKGRVVFTSSQGEESSWIRPDNEMSIYTYHLIEALQGKGTQSREDVVKISHLMNYLSDKVPKSASILCKKTQTPYFNFESEDFSVAQLNDRRSDKTTEGQK